MPASKPTRVCACRILVGKLFHTAPDTIAETCFRKLVRGNGTASLPSQLLGK